MIVWSTSGALPTGTLTFAPGELFQNITINVANDQALEVNDAFTVKQHHH